MITGRRLRPSVPEAPLVRVEADKAQLGCGRGGERCGLVGAAVAYGEVHEWPAGFADQWGGCPGRLVESLVGVVGPSLDQDGYELGDLAGRRRGVLPLDV